MFKLGIALLVSCSLFAKKIDFVRQVQPILELRCVRCHGPGAAMRNLRLDRRDRAMTVIIPHRPGDSRLYLAMKSGFMPPGDRKMPPEEIEIIRRWIAEGAHWPKNVELRPINPFTQR